MGIKSVLAFLNHERHPRVSLISLETSSGSQIQRILYFWYTFLNPTGMFLLSYHGHVVVLLGQGMISTSTCFVTFVWPTSIILVFVWLIYMDEYT